MQEISLDVRRMQTTEQCLQRANCTAQGGWCHGAGIWSKGAVCIRAFENPWDVGKCGETVRGGCPDGVGPDAWEWVGMN